MPIKYDEYRVIRLVQHRPVEERNTGTSIYRIAFPASKTQFTVQKAPAWLEVPRAAESEMPAAVRTVWVLHPREESVAQTALQHKKHH